MPDKRNKYDIGPDGRTYGRDRKGAGILTHQTEPSALAIVDISLGVISGRKQLMFLMMTMITRMTNIDRTTRRARMTIAGETAKTED